MSSAKWRLSRLGLNELSGHPIRHPYIREYETSLTLGLASDSKRRMTGKTLKRIIIFGTKIKHKIIYTWFEKIYEAGKK